MNLKNLIQRSIILLFIFGLSPNLHAQEKMKFPKILAQDIDGNSVNVPDNSTGKFALLGLAYSKKAESDLETWLNPVYNKFIAKTGMFDSFYDIDVFFIPIFTGANQGAFATSIKQAKAKTDKEIRGNVLFYKGDISEFKEILEINRDAPVFVLINKEGRIIWKSSGAYTEKKMEEIEDLISE